MSSNYTPNDPEFVKAKNSLDDLVIRARGLYIHRFVELEMNLNLYLAQFFCSTLSKQNDILIHIFGTSRITLESKMEMFLDILESRQNEIYKALPVSKTEIQRMIERRNQFAHLSIDYSDGIVPNQGVITLLKWKGDKTKPIVYTTKEYDEHLAKVYRLYEFIGNLINFDIPIPSTETGS